MSKVFITLANLKHIIEKSPTVFKNTRKEMQAYLMNEDFEDDSNISEILDMYTTPELKDMYFMKFSLVESAKFFEDIIEAHKKLQKSIETQNKTLVFAVKNPSYHVDKACKYLHSIYTNIELPEDFRNETARDWVQKYRNIYSDFDNLNVAFKQHFSTEKNLKEINRKNSGQDDIENNLLSEMLDETYLETKTQLKMLFNPAVYEFIEKYKFVSKHTVDNMKDKENSNQKIITEYYYAKEMMKKIILSKLQRQYNSDLAFDKTYLDNLGFKCCKGCCAELGISTHVGTF